VKTLGPPIIALLAVQHVACSGRTDGLAVASSPADGASSTTASDWVWQSAAPVSGQINAIWASTPDDAWAVGDSGFAMHWDGIAWSRVASNTINHLNGIWGSSANDVWAVAGGIGGDGAFNLIHWDGQAWSPASADTSSNLAGVWGTGPSDVWAVGGSGMEGVITHFDGSAWHLASTTPFSDLKGVWGSGPSQVWAAGYPYGSIRPDESNSILERVGDAWNPIADNAPDPQAKVLTSVWAAGTGQAWATGYGAILYWNGTAWAPSTAGYFEHIWGRSSNDIWAASSGTFNSESGVFHFDGATWVSQGLGDARLYAVGGASAAVGGREGVWAGGEAVFELVPGAKLTCQTIGGTCGSSCRPGEGHPSDYSCDDGSVCCVSVSACGGASEPVCCRQSDHTVIPDRRPICHDGVFSCGPDADASGQCGQKV
jgi:hypothetical protein